MTIVKNKDATPFPSDGCGYGEKSGSKQKVRFSKQIGAKGSDDGKNSERQKQIRSGKPADKEKHEKQSVFGKRDSTVS